jgi:hypothetical protein
MEVRRVSENQERLREQHKADALDLDDEAFDRKWSRLTEEGLEMMVTHRDHHNKTDVRRFMTQKDVMEALREYANAALNQDAGALWDAVPDQEIELWDDIRLWVVNFK